MLKYLITILFGLTLAACGGDKPAESMSDDSAMADSPAAPAADSSSMSEEYGMTIDHSRDEAEYELRRSIGGLERMIEQYTADGHATDELMAQKAELSASLEALLGQG